MSDLLDLETTFSLIQRNNPSFALESVRTLSLCVVPRGTTLPGLPPMTPAKATAFTQKRDQILQRLQQEPGLREKAIRTLVVRYDYLSHEPQQAALATLRTVPSQELLPIVLNHLDSASRTSALAVAKALTLDIVPAVIAQFVQQPGGPLADFLASAGDARAVPYLVRSLAGQARLTVSNRTGYLIGAAAGALEALLRGIASSVSMADLTTILNLPDMETNSMRAVWEDPDATYNTASGYQEEPSYKEERAVCSLAACRQLARAELARRR